MRWLRRIGFSLVLSMVFMGIGYVTLPDRYVKLLLVESVQAFSGGTLEIGSLSLERGADPRLTLANVSWQDASEPQPGYRLTLGKVETTMDLSSLLRARLSLESLSMSNAQLYVQVDDSGSDTDSRVVGSYRLTPRWLEVGFIKLAQVEVHYDNSSTDRHYVLSLDTLDMPGGNTLPGSEFRARGTLNDIPLSVALTVNDDASNNQDGPDNPERRIRLDAIAGSVSANGTGTINLENDSFTLNGAVSAHAETLADVGSLMQQDWPAIGPVDLQATVTGDLEDLNTQGLDISDLKVDLVDPTLQAQLKGAVDDVPTNSIARLQLSASAPDASVVTQVLGWPLPAEWGSLEARGLLEGSRGNYALNALDIDLEGETSAHASGSLGSLFPMDELRLKLDVTLATLTELSLYTAHELPDIGPMAGTGVLGWQQGQLSLSDAHATHTSALGTAVVTGNIGDLVHFDQVRLRADADLPDFSVLSLFSNAKLPAVDHVQASANLISTTAGNLSARQLRVSARRGELTMKGKGSMDSFIRGGGILDLDLSASLGTLQSLDGFVDHSLPDIGPIDLTARLSGQGQDIQLNAVNVTSHDASLSGTIQGDVGPVTEPLQGAFMADLASTSVADTVGKLGMFSTVTKPATLAGQLIVSDKTVKFLDAQLTVADNALSGNITLQNAWGGQAKPFVTGNVNIDRLDLIKLHDKQPDDHAETSTANRVFPDQALPFDEIGMADIDIKVGIDTLTSLLFEITDAGLTAKARNGMLHIGSFTGKVNAGDAVFELTIDSTQRPPGVTVDASLEGVDLGRAGLFAGSNVIENTGGSSLTLSLTGQGKSVAEILGSASGEGGLYIEDLLFKKDVLAWLSSDLLEQITRSLYPSSDLPDETRFECTALAFQIDKGKLSTPFGLGIVSDNFSIVGNATFDLSTEQMQLDYSTKPRHGLGIGLNTVVNVTTLKGPLNSPSLSISQSGLLRFGATVGAAIASSGLSLLAEGLYEKHQANADVCAEAMGQ